MVFTFVLLLSPQSFLPALAPLHLALLAAGVAMAAHLLERLSRGAAMIGTSAEIRIALALAVWAALTALLSLWPSGSLGYLIDPFLKSLIVFWLLASVVVTSERLRRTAWCLVLMTTPLAFTGVRHLLSGVFVPEGNAPGFARIAGYEAPLTANPNDLALTLNLILPLGVALLLTVKRPILRALVLAVVALDVLAVISTFSRGGFLTLATILLAYIVRLRRRFSAVLLLPLMLLLCVPLLPSGYLDQMGTITRIGSDPTGSAQERWRDLLASGRVIQSRPLTGVGIGMNALALNAERGATWRMVHNVYLQYAVELGLPGLILFLVLLVRCIRKAGAARLIAARMENGGLLFHLAEAVQISLIAFAVAALVHPAGYNFYFYYLAGLALGLEAAVTAQKAHEGASLV
jgi:probable O-glycosylation ligase (exosortase A-associated)